MFNAHFLEFYLGYTMQDWRDSQEDPGMRDRMSKGWIGDYYFNLAVNLMSR